MPKAFEAATNGASTLEVDCAVRSHIGSDISCPIVIDSGNKVEFTASRTITVDNVLGAASVIANSHSVPLTDWNVVYDSSFPTYMKTGWYESKERGSPHMAISRPRPDLRIRPSFTG